MTVQEFAVHRSLRLSDNGRFDSNYALLRAALSMYGEYFLTFFTIYAVAVLPTSIPAILLAKGEKSDSLTLTILSILSGVAAFAALAVAASDAAVGNRPNFRRSWRRAFGRRGFAVVVNSAICCVVISLPGLIAWLGIMATSTWLSSHAKQDFAAYVGYAGYAAIIIFMPLILVNTTVAALVLMYVPIISVLELRVGVWRSIRRSVSLGRHHRMRAVTLIAITMVTFLLVLAFVALATNLTGLETKTAAATAVTIVNVLVMPWAYIAAVLLYFDLRSRKEGYGLAERAEDIY